MTTPTKMTNEQRNERDYQQLFASTASSLVMMSVGLRRNLKRIRRVDFQTENHMQEAIENLQQTLCVIWEDFEVDELTKSYRRENKHL
jgi:hypothetical protein